MKNLIALGILALAFGFCMSIAAAEDTVITNDTGDQTVIAPAPNASEAVETGAEETEDTLMPEELEDIDETFPEATGDAGATPDSPIMYGLDRAMERISLALTLGKAAKAQKGLAHARERLLEVKAMILAKKAAKAERARELYEEQMNEVQDEMEDIDEDGQEGRIVEAARNFAKLQNSIEDHGMAVEALKEILNSQNLTEQQRAVLEALVAKIESKAQGLKEKAEQKQEKAMDRLRAVTGKNESEIDEVMENISSEEGLAQSRQAKAERWITRTEESFAKVKAKIEEGKLSGLNMSSELEAYLAEIEGKLNEAKAAYSAGEYEKALEILKPVNNYGRQLSQVVKMKNKIEKLKEVRQKELNRIQEKVAKLDEKKARILSRIRETASIAAGNDGEEGQASGTSDSAKGNSNKGKNK